MQLLLVVFVCVCVCVCLCVGGRTGMGLDGWLVQVVECNLESPAFFHLILQLSLWDLIFFPVKNRPHILSWEREREREIVNWSLTSYWCWHVLFTELFRERGVELTAGGRRLRYRGANWVKKSLEKSLILCKWSGNLASSGQLDCLLSSLTVWKLQEFDCLICSKEKLGGPCKRLSSFLVR